MGVRGSCCVVAAVATICAPTAGAAGRLVSVGYSAPSALHGLRVDLRVPALRTARVHVPSLRAVRQLRARSGIRFVQLEQPRADTGAPTLSAASTPAVPEWQWAAAHEDLVPPWVQAAAASVTIAVVDTGALPARRAATASGAGRRTRPRRSPVRRRSSGPRTRRSTPRASQPPSRRRRRATAAGRGSSRSGTSTSRPPSTVPRAARPRRSRRSRGLSSCESF
jgi:hypothetical protein